MNPIQVISAGPGDEAHLTCAARRAMEECDVLFAAQRHRSLLPMGREARPLEPLSGALDEVERETGSGKRVGVLVSGDAGLYSLLGMLKSRFGAKALTVHPGVSALQALCAAAVDMWQDAAIISGHGRELTVSALLHYVRTHKKTIMFCDGRRGARWAAEALCEAGLSEAALTVGERLGSADEKLTRGCAADIRNLAFDPLSMVLIHNPAPVSGLPSAGLPDEAFARGKVPMTKREIRMQVLAELSLRPDSVVWDIGAGTGSVAIECARQCPLGQVFAIERNPEGVSLIGENAGRLGVYNVSIIPGEAPGCLAPLPRPSHVFIGGSGGELGGVFEAIEAMSSPVRVVATAVTLETEAQLALMMGGYSDFHMAQHAVTRLRRVGGYHMREAQNPVTIVSGIWEGKR